MCRENTTKTSHFVDFLSPGTSVYKILYKTIIKEKTRRSGIEINIYGGDFAESKIKIVLPLFPCMHATDEEVKGLDAEPAFMCWVNVIIS